LTLINDIDDLITNINKRINDIIKTMVKFDVYYVDENNQNKKKPLEYYDNQTVSLDDIFNNALTSVNNKDSYKDIVK
jgi:hypothetical protein